MKMSFLISSSFAITTPLKGKGIVKPVFSTLTHFAVVKKRTMSTEVDDVLFEDVGDKGRITLNRPKALNALDLSMVKKLLPVLLRWEKDKKMVLVKGAGGKAFCAGGDVRAVTLASKKGESYGKDFFRDEYTVNSIIGTYRIPYIALIDGITMGGGMGLSVHAPYRIATERTLCAMPETAIGLFPDVGGSYFLPRLEGKLGAFLALTGYRLKGVDNLLAGIATHYCASSELPALEEAILKGSNPSEVLASYSSAPNNSKFSLEPYLDKINFIFSAPTMEEIFSRLEKDGSEWASQTLSTLKKFSPLSMKITLKELELGAQLSLQECLQMEYRLACRACDGNDFIEGVRALLVDKDQNPKWVPSSIEQVTQEMVDNQFSPLSPEKELQPRSGPKSSL